MTHGERPESPKPAFTVSPSRLLGLRVLSVGARRLASAFAAGFCQPSLLAVTIALLLCLGGIGAACLLITEAKLTGERVAWYALDPLDDYAFATGTALALRAQPPQGPAVALIGTAAMREALIPDEEIAARLTRRAGTDVPVIDFMSGGQSGIEMAALADSLGPDFEGVVVLGISLSRLAADSSELAGLVREPRLAFASAAGDAEIRAAGFSPPWHSGIYFLDNYKFFVARARVLLGRVLGGAVPVHASRTYLDRAPADARQWETDTRILQARLAHYAERADGNLAAMKRVIGLFPDRRKVRIVLLEIPLNPRAVSTVIGPELVEAHRARLRAFAEREGVEYWDLNPVVLLGPDDFQDWAHVNRADARERWTAPLLDRLLPLLRVPSR